MSEIQAVAVTEEDDQHCIYDDCPGVPESEMDGGYFYFSCPECGSEWGYRQLPSKVDDESCGIGVPVDVRRAASTPMEAAIAQEEARKNFRDRWVGQIGFRKEEDGA